MKADNKDLKNTDRKILTIERKMTSCCSCHRKTLGSDPVEESVCSHTSKYHQSVAPQAQEAAGGNSVNHQSYKMRTSSLLPAGCSWF